MTNTIKKIQECAEQLRSAVLELNKEQIQKTTFSNRIHVPTKSDISIDIVLGDGPVEISCIFFATNEELKKLSTLL